MNYSAEEAFEREQEQLEAASARRLRARVAKLEARLAALEAAARNAEVTLNAVADSSQVPGSIARQARKDAQVMAMVLGAEAV